VLFDSTRSNARFHSSACRSRAWKARKDASVGARAEKAKAVPVALRESSGLVAAVTAELEAAGRLESVPGRQALALARAMDDPSTSAAAVASSSREFSRVREQALRGAVVVRDGVDEVAARREAKVKAASA
jgi:hypothetical protein